MHIGNFQSASGRMQEARDELFRTWNGIRERWDDDNARRFEETILQRISEETAQALPAIIQISQTFAAAQRDCAE